MNGLPFCTEKRARNQVILQSFTEFLRLVITPGNAVTSVFDLCIAKTVF